MELSDNELSLIEALCDGLALVARPYAQLGERAGLGEDETIATIQSLLERGIINRFGVIVQHRSLGYTANAMSVWDVPDDTVTLIGKRMGQQPGVTLCYRRPRRMPDWPFNLFAMVHGQDRERVLEQVDIIACNLGLEDVRRDVLFSTRQFKQRGARYQSTPREVAHAPRTNA